MGKQAGKIALGLGLITGAITGLLFAPDEGKNIRKKIAKGDTKGLLDDLESMGNEIKDMAHDIVSSPGMHDLMEKGKNMASDVANVRREELDAMLAKANKKAEAFKKKVATYVKEQKAILEANMEKPTKKPAKKTAKKKPAKKVEKKETKKPVKKTATKKKSTPKKK